MPFKFSVLVLERNEKWLTTLANFETDQITLSSAPTSPRGPDAVEVGHLFSQIQRQKRLRILVGAGLPDPTHAFWAADRKKALLDLDIALVRYRVIHASFPDGKSEMKQDIGTLDTLTLSRVQVESFQPIGGGAYIANLKVAGDTRETFVASKGLRYAISVYLKTSDAGDYYQSRSFMAGFDALQIFGPGPALGPVTNEVQVGQLFQAIEELRQLYIKVGGGAGPGLADATHFFMEAHQKRKKCDLEILLWRDTPKYGTYQQMQSDWTFKPVSYVKAIEHKRLAMLRLRNVKVEDYLPTNDGAYLATLKVTGGIGETDMDQDEENK